MSITNNVDKIIDGLVNRGSCIEGLESFRKEIISELRKDNSLSETLNEVAKQLKEETEEFLCEQNADGINFINNISTCIYLPDYDTGGSYKLRLIGGTKSRTSNIDINENTMYDLASITKLYTLLLVFKLVELGIISLDDKIVDLNPDFKDLEDFTIKDFLILRGRPWTRGNLAEIENQEEAKRVFKTMYLIHSDYDNKYTDFGAMVIGDTIAKVISRLEDKEMSLEDVMDKYLFKPLGLDSTMFNPDSYNVTGNGNDEGKPHDPKCRNLGGVTAHAGLFSTNNDIAKTADSIFTASYINHEHIASLGEYTFPQLESRNRGLLGMYLKGDKIHQNTYVPSEFSTGSFSSEGYTGSLATFDVKNHLHFNILVDAVLSKDSPVVVKTTKPYDEVIFNAKARGFANAQKEYNACVISTVLKDYVIREYYKTIESADVSKKMDVIHKVL